MKKISLSKVIHDYLAGIGRRGGSSTSNAKAAASRANGCKGGRPRQPLCKRCRWIHDMRCPLTAHERYVRIHDRACLYGPRCKLYEDTQSRLAKQPSLKQSRTGRSLPASVGRGPSKKKKSS